LVEKDPKKLQSCSAGAGKGSGRTRRLGKRKVAERLAAIKDGRECWGRTYPRPATPPPSQWLNGFRGNRVEILGCGNKLIEIFRPLSQRTDCAPLRYPRAGKVLPSEDGVHCRQKFPIRIWLENVPFRSVA